MANPQKTEKPDDSATMAESPPLPTSDWDGLSEEVEAPIEDLDAIGPNGIETEDSTESLEEEDDNPYQDSDEALPDDKEEAAINRDLYREGKFFNEV